MDVSNNIGGGSVGIASHSDVMSNHTIDDEDTQGSTSNSTSSSTNSTAMPSTCNQNQEPHSEWAGSLVEYYGPSSSFCGYCKRSNPPSDGGRQSYDMQAYRLTAEDYQTFLDRGWRRSGKFCYCPTNQTTCCPNYSITCQAIKFNLTRSQRKCIERLNNFLYAGSIKHRAPINYDSNHDLFQISESSSKQISKSIEQLKISPKARDRRYVKTCEKKAQLNNISLEEALEVVKNKWQQRRPQLLSLEDYLYPRRASSQVDNLAEEAKHKLEINMYYVDSRQSKELREEEHNIMVKYQKSIHKETRREWTMSRYCDFLVGTPIIVKKLDSYDYLQDGTSDEDEVARETLSKNLHSTNTSFILHRPPQLPTAYGTYHCSYHLDGKLIAVGVLDVLPRCITTVYFFYDPEYSFLNLGVYSALVEISMVRQMWSRYKAPTINSENILKHYYLGYYVHECKKMHYKTRFKPSYLLCCKSYEYVKTEKCLELLKHTKYAEFSSGSTDLNLRRDTIEFQRLLEVSIEWPQDIEHFPAGTTKLLNYLLWLETNLGTEYVELFVNGYLATFAHLIGAELLGRLCLKTNIVHRTLMRRRDRLVQCRQQKSSSSSQSSGQRERAL